MKLLLEYVSESPVKKGMFIIVMVSRRRVASPVYSDFTHLTWWRHKLETFPRHWPFVRDIHRSPINSPHKGQWRGALMFPLICVWHNSWLNNGDVGDLRCHRAHYDVTILSIVLQRATKCTGQTSRSLPMTSSWSTPCPTTNPGSTIPTRAML